MGSVNCHDENVSSAVSSSVKMSGHRLITIVNGVTAVFQKSGFQRSFGFTDILCTALSARDDIDDVGGETVQRMCNWK